MSRAFRDLINCIKYIPFIIGYGQAVSLNNIYRDLSRETRIERIYGYVALKIGLEAKEKILLGSIYRVDNSGYLFYRYGIRKEAEVSEELPEIFLIKEKELGKYLKHHDIKVLLKKKNALSKLGSTCWGRRTIECILSTGDELDYSFTYLYLAVKCREDFLEISSIELFDKMIHVMRKPLIDMIKYLVDKKNIEKAYGEKLIDTIDKNMLTVISALIARRKLVLPDIKDVNDLVNYVKTHLKL